MGDQAMRHDVHQPLKNADLAKREPGSRRQLLGQVARTGAGVVGLSLTGGCSVIFQSEEQKRQQALRQAMNQELKPLNARVGDPIFIRVFKTEALLELWVQPRGKGRFVKFRDMPICAYSGQIGPKQREGDLQAPEGFYSVRADQLNPNSQFHRSFNLGFPNLLDQQHGRTGSYLMIHGDCVSVGCYAMTDPGIDVIYTLASGYLERNSWWGQAPDRHFWVHAFPFKPTPENLAQAQQSGSPWTQFWTDLSVGYQMFNQTQLPPNVGVAAGRYVLTPS